MRKYLLVTLCLLSSILGNAQIIGPDTVFINTIDTFSSGNEATTYSWIFDTVNVAQPIASDTSSAGGFSVPAFSKMINDNGVWYCFVTNYGTGEIMRLDYSTDPTGTPTQHVIATPSFTFPDMEGIDIIKDSGNWYGFVASGNQIDRLDFGASLSATPTETFITLSSLSYPHQISISKYGTNWIGFIGDRSSGIIRLDFGSSITNTPASTVIPVVGSYNSPCNFSLYKEGSNWYMLTTNLTDKTVTRIEFGSNIQNNTPTGTLLGTPFTTTYALRSVNIIPDCNQLYAYVMDEEGTIGRLDFRGSITNNPDTTVVASLTGISLANSACPYVYDHKLNFMVISTFTNSMYRYSLLTYPNSDTTIYYQPNITHRFTTLGLHDITLYCDHGAPTGPSAYCKEVYVRANVGVSQIEHPSSYLNIYPNPAGNYFTIKGRLKYTANTTVNIEIVNPIGQEIFTTAFAINQGIIDQQITLNSSIPSGNYFVRILTQSDMQILPLTVVR